MPDIQKVSIALTSEQIAALKTAVDTGEYATTSEIIREALREWQWKREQRGADLARLRKLWLDGKASGAPASVDLRRTRELARQRLRKAAEKIA